MIQFCFRLVRECIMELLAACRLILELHCHCPHPIHKELTTMCVYFLLQIRSACLSLLSSTTHEFEDKCPLIQNRLLKFGTRKSKN